MKNLILVATVTAALIATTGLGHASTLDQNNAFGNGNANGSFEWQQQVTAGLSGQLAGITLYDIYGETATVSIGIGDAFTNSFVFSESVSLNGGSSGWNPGSTFIDTSAANIILTAGERFVIDESGASLPYSIDFANSSYTGGDLYTKLGANSPVDFDTVHGNGSLPFQTYMDTDPTPTPEPSSLLLLLTGLSAGVLLLRRRSEMLGPAPLVSSLLRFGIFARCSSTKSTPSAVRVSAELSARVM